MKDDTYYFHQTPEQLCKDIISNIVFEPDDIVFEPFSGENNFFKNFPEDITKYRCEIEDGLDFKNFDYHGIKPTTILTNPPFRLDTDNGRKNAFFDILMFFAKTPVKRVIFLCSDYCFGSLTPNRLLKLNNEGLYIHSLTTCSVKKWRGRYYVITFKREPNIFFNYFLENFE